MFQLSNPRFLTVALICLATLLGTNLQSQAEAAEVTPFIGFWEIPEPAGDTAIVIVKRGGRLSTFWTGSGGGRGIIQGRYTLEDGRLIATWPDGNRDVFRVLGQDSIQRETFLRGASLDSTPTYRIRGTRVDNRLPGSLAVASDTPRERQDTAAQEIITPVRTSFLGFWRVEQSPGGVLGVGGRSERHFFLHINRNGQARVALRNWSAGNDVVGKWVEEGSEVRITWPDGQKDTLREDGQGGHELLSFSPRRAFTDRPNERRSATRSSVNDAQTHFRAGDFRMVTTTDVVGTWVPVQTNDTSKGHLELENWGRAFRFPSTTGTGSDSGQWQLQNDRVVITWVDGSRDVLRLELRGFVRESFPAGVALTEPPATSVPVRRFAERITAERR
ncbi:MAG: hypothetical protein LR015_04755 [Verrucomicrobia bacterium]|nr:hypothetical protein [Verrucomicrobiota bacterium]